ncbi:MAG: hypothetical protein LQ341_004606, partial [Variospora aurantia]
MSSSNKAIAGIRANPLLSPPFPSPQDTGLSGGESGRRDAQRDTGLSGGESGPRDALRYAGPRGRAGGPCDTKRSAGPRGRAGGPRDTKRSAGLSGGTSGPRDAQRCDTESYTGLSGPTNVHRGTVSRADPYYRESRHSRVAVQESGVNSTMRGGDRPLDPHLQMDLEDRNRSNDTRYKTELHDIYARRDYYGERDRDYHGQRHRDDRHEIYRDNRDERHSNYHGERTRDDRGEIHRDNRSANNERGRYRDERGRHERGRSMSPVTARRHDDSARSSRLQSHHRDNHEAHEPMYPDRRIPSRLMISEAELSRNGSTESARILRNYRKKDKWFYRASKRIIGAYLDDNLVNLSAGVLVAWDIPHTTAAHYMHHNQMDRKVAEDIAREREMEPRRFMRWSIPIGELEAFWQIQGYDMVPNLEMFRDHTGTSVQMPVQALLSSADAHKEAKQSLAEKALPLEPVHRPENHTSMNCTPKLDHGQQQTEEQSLEQAVPGPEDFDVVEDEECKHLLTSESPFEATYIQAGSSIVIDNNGEIEDLSPASGQEETPIIIDDRKEGNLRAHDKAMAIVEARATAAIVSHPDDPSIELVKEYFNNILYPGGAISSYRTQVKADSFATLFEGEWLDDEIVNGFLGLVADLSPRTVLLESGFTAYLSEGMESLNPKDPLHTRSKINQSQDIMLIPVCQNKDHWVLFIAECGGQSGTIKIYNSISGRDVDVYEMGSKVKLGLEASESLFRSVTWLVEVSKDRRIQNNGCDCGPFICANAVAALLDIPWDGTATGLRYHIAQQILDAARQSLDGKNLRWLPSRLRDSKQSTDEALSGESKIDESYYAPVDLDKVESTDEADEIWGSISESKMDYQPLKARGNRYQSWPIMSIKGLARFYGYDPDTLYKRPTTKTIVITWLIQGRYQTLEEYPGPFITADENKTAATKCVDARSTYSSMTDKEIRHEAWRRGMPFRWNGSRLFFIDYLERSSQRSSQRSLFLLTARWSDAPALRSPTISSLNMRRDEYLEVIEPNFKPDMTVQVGLVRKATDPLPALSTRANGQEEFYFYHWGTAEDIFVRSLAAMAAGARVVILVSGLAGLASTEQAWLAFANDWRHLDIKLAVIHVHDDNDTGFSSWVESPNRGVWYTFDLQELVRTFKGDSSRAEYTQWIEVMRREANWRDSESKLTAEHYTSGLKPKRSRNVLTAKYESRGLLHAYQGSAGGLRPTLIDVEKELHLRLLTTTHTISTTSAFQNWSKQSQHAYK